VDALSETLRVVRLIGAIFINAKFTAPWCYQSPSADSGAPLLEPGAERVVIFHLITEGECYVDLVGSSPMQYLTQWRMLLAANLLCRSNAPLARIAEDVGYQTDTAFSRAFRREFGSPPAAWRRNQSTRDHIR